MAKKSLATASLVTSMMKTGTVIVEIDGSIRRITLDNLINVINDGGNEMLRQLAIGIPIKQTQSSPDWGRVGNLDIWEAYKSQCGCYLLTFDGKAAKLSSTSKGMFADGTTVDESKGNIVWIGPRLYYLVQVDEVSNIPYLWLSPLPISEHYIGNAGDGKYNVIGCYLGSYDEQNRLRSVSGVNVKASQNINQFWNAAQKNGEDYGLVDYDFIRLTVMMNLAQYGNPNVQENLGYGPGGDADNWEKVKDLTTGATKALGDDFGVVDISSVTGNQKSCHTSFMGIENLYNWYWQMFQGLYFGNSENAGQNGTEVFIYKGNRLPSAGELSSVPAGDFRQITRLTQSGWMGEIVLGEFFDIIAKAIAGGSNSRWCDYTYNNNTGQLGLWGANADDAANAGLGYVHSNHGWSLTNTSCASRLAYYGKLEFVDGRQV